MMKSNRSTIRSKTSKKNLKRLKQLKIRYCLEWRLMMNQWSKKLRHKQNNYTLFSSLWHLLCRCREMWDRTSTWSTKCRKTSLTTWWIWWSKTLNWCANSMRQWMASNWQINNSSKWWLTWHLRPFDRALIWRRMIPIFCGERRSFKRGKGISHNRHKCNNHNNRCHRCKGCQICQIWLRWWTILWSKKWWTTLRWWRWPQRWWEIWVAAWLKTHQRCKKWWKIHLCLAYSKTLISWHHLWTC